MSQWLFEALAREDGTCKPNPGGHLRDQVRRPIRRGHCLMGGGYRQFLIS
nr:DUF2285 domain-containing protein [Mesorhizobium sp. WSM2561]